MWTGLGSWDLRGESGGENANSLDASNHEQLSPYYSVDQRASNKKKEETSQE